MTAPRAILHVDMDAFYASVEQRDRPELRGQPLIVGGTSNRGVVAAASYEVRKFGVRSAMPIREALRRCPHAICVKPRMSVYREVSHQVFAVFHEYTPIVEGLSLDEAFLDVTASLALKGDSITIARNIKQRIRDTTQLAASVGVAPNKLVAKIASELEKPDGLTVINVNNMHAVLDPLSVRRLPGLGRKLGERVEAAGLATFGAAWYARGLSLRDLGRLTDARDSLARAREFGTRWPGVPDPVLARVRALRDDANAHLALGLTLDRDGDIAGATREHEHSTGDREGKWSRNKFHEEENGWTVRQSYWESPPDPQGF